MGRREKRGGNVLRECKRKQETESSKSIVCGRRTRIIYLRVNRDTITANGEMDNSIDSISAVCWYFFSLTPCSTLFSSNEKSSYRSTNTLVSAASGELPLLLIFFTELIAILYFSSFFFAIIISC